MSIGLLYAHGPR